MIKNLLNADEEMPPETKISVEETVVNSPAENAGVSALLAVEEIPEDLETRQVFEIPESAKFFAKPPETSQETAQTSEVSEPTIEPIIETVKDESVNLQSPQIKAADSSYIEQFDDEKTNDDSAPTIFQSAYKPPTTAESVRQSGLAWSAGIVFFGSIVFMMILGWFADLLLGSSPWGIVGGIVLGAIIGFVQFFRISSQIFKI